MAAITTDPLSRVSPLDILLTSISLPNRFFESLMNLVFISLIVIRSWGRFGPARLGSISPKSISTYSLYFGTRASLK